MITFVLSTISGYVLAWFRQLITTLVASIRRNPIEWIIGASIVVAVISCSVIYDAGVKAERARQATATRDRELAQIHAQIEIADRLADSTSQIEAAAHAAAVRSTTRQSVTRRAAATARQRVVVTSNSTVSVDHGPPIDVSLPVVDVIRSADAALVADSVAADSARQERSAIAANRDAVTRQRDLQRTRADTLAAQDPRDVARCGTKCKAAVVATVVVATVAAVVHLKHPTP